MLMVDLPVLWRSFLHGMLDLLTAIRRMPVWVYLLLLFAAALANLLALGVFR